MKSSKQAMKYVDNLPWPVGIKYMISDDLLELVLFKDNVAAVCKTPDTLMQFRNQVYAAMTELRTVNPACELVVRDGG